MGGANATDLLLAAGEEGALFSDVGFVTVLHKNKKWGGGGGGGVQDREKKGMNGHSRSRIAMFKFNEERSQKTITENGNN